MRILIGEKHMDIVERIEQLLGEKTKKKDKDKNRQYWGDPDKKAQKKYIGHGSIKDLAK